MIDRPVVMLVPLFALLIPIVRFAPSLYGWRVRPRIFKGYGQMKAIEAELDLEPSRHTREEWLATGGEFFPAARSSSADE